MVDYTSQVGREPQLDPRQFNWVRVFNAGLGGVTGNLETPGANVLTFEIMPRGLAVTDYVYISGGTGTAEAVPISLVSGSAGGPGTITVTTANAHSGTWQVGSASAGIQEALNSVARPSVFLPAGTYTLYATVTLPVGAEIVGVGQSSWVVLGTPGMTGFYATSIAGFSDLNLHNFYLAGNAGNTDEKGIHFVSLSGPRVFALKVDSVYRAIYWDRVNEGSVSNILLMNDASIYVGSQGGPTDFSFQNQINDITHYATSASLTIPEVVHLEHAAITTIRGLKVRSCRYDCIGVRIAGGGEGTILDDVTIVQATTGIQFESSGGRFPFFTNISRCQVDMPAIFGINLTDGTQTTIENCSITGRNDDGAYPNPPQHGIFVNESAHAVIIQNNKFQNWYAGNIITLHNGNVDTAILNNYFRNGSGTNGIVVGTDSSAVNDKILIEGNHFGNGDASASKITINGATSANLDVISRDNLGIDEKNGPDFNISGSGQTIQVFYPIHVITGTGTVSTINQSPHFRTREFKMIPSSTASVQLVTGGNIGAAATIVPGRVMTMTYNRGDSKWYPSYV